MGKQGLCSAQDGALVPVFEKSATELKPQQKLLKCKGIVHIAKLNVRTLNRISQQLEMTACASGHDKDMYILVCIQEHRFHHNELEIKYHNSYNGWTFIFAFKWKNSVNAIIGGVGMFLNARSLKSLNSIKKIQLRMMVAIFNGNPSTTIISCSNSTNANDVTDFITFYNELSSLVSSIPKHNVLIIRG